MNNDHPSLKNWHILALLASVAFILTYQYIQIIELPLIEARRQIHLQILSGTAEMPYQSRLLAPYLAALFEKLFKIILGGDTFWLGYACYDILAIFLSLSTLFAVLRLWFDRPISLIGTLIAALSMLVGFRDHYFQPWSLLEPAILAAGLWLIAKKKFLPLAFLIAIGTLNRETTLLLVFASFLVWMPLPKFWQAFQKSFGKQWQKSLILLLIWCIVFGTLAWIYRDLPRTISLSQILDKNLEPANLRLTIHQWILFGGVFWIFAILGFKQSPPFIKRMALLLPIYLMMLLPYALWFEVRLLMTIYPIFIPLGISYLYPPRITES